MRIVKPITFIAGAPRLNEIFKRMQSHTDVESLDLLDAVYKPDAVVRIRDYLNLSQQQLAKLMNVDAETVARWETTANNEQHEMMPPSACKLLSYFFAGYRPIDWPSD